jgi:hypothetical protein
MIKLRINAHMSNMAKKCNPELNPAIRFRPARADFSGRNLEQQNHPVHSGLLRHIRSDLGRKSSDN